MDGIIIVIKRLRKFKGITQEAMAEHIHLSLRAYQKIESGDTKLDIDRLKIIADILGVSMIDLVNAKGKAERLMSGMLGNTNDKEPVRHQQASHILKWLLQIIIESKDKEVSYLQEVSERDI